MATNDVLDAEEVGRLLRVHQRTVIRLASQGQLPGFKVGGQWRFKRQDIEDYIEEQKRRYIDKKDEEQ
jgi:excisionase family DNA binding protein